MAVLLFYAKKKSKQKKNREYEKKNNKSAYKNTGVCGRKTSLAHCPNKSSNEKKNEKRSLCTSSQWN